MFDRNKLKFLPLSKKISKTCLPILNNIALTDKAHPAVPALAKKILESRTNKKPVVISFGAHLIKNGLSPLINDLIQKGIITHLATNGAGSIHDWELAFHGKTEEDVKSNVEVGQFGLWEELGRFINLALINGARNQLGYGESIGKMIYEETVADIQVPHPFKNHSIQACAFANNVNFTVHPGFGYDIIYMHPLSDGASIGKVAEIDFLKFVSTVSNLEGGIYLSVGSAVMSPMIFEKSLSMARNVAHQQGQNIKDFSIVINDLADPWESTPSKNDPRKNDPRYYYRVSKSFGRMGAREVLYMQMDNRDFIKQLWCCLNTSKEGK